MLVGTQQRLRNIFDKTLNVTYKGVQISSVKEYKYLGNIVDQHLNFNKNFDKVYKKASARLNLLKRSRTYLTKHAA